MTTFEDHLAQEFSASEVRMKNLTARRIRRILTREERRAKNRRRLEMLTGTLMFLLFFIIAAYALTVFAGG